MLRKVYISALQGDAGRRPMWLPTMAMAAVFGGTGIIVKE
jgi:hypothetical protein